MLAHFGMGQDCTSVYTFSAWEGSELWAMHSGLNNPAGCTGKKLQYVSEYQK